MKHQMEIFDSSRRIETLAIKLVYETEKLPDTYRNIKDLATKIKKEAYDNAELANDIIR